MLKEGIYMLFVIGMLIFERKCEFSGEYVCDGTKIMLLLPIIYRFENLFHALSTLEWVLAANPEWLVIHHEDKHVKKWNKIVFATSFVKGHLSLTRKNDISLETFDQLLVWNMLFSILFNIFLSEPKIDKVDLGVSLHASLSVNHDVVKLEIIESSLGAVGILEDANQL